MNFPRVISTINDYPFHLNIKWLAARSPKISENRCHDAWLGSLSYLQRQRVDQGHIASLDGLDLPTVLRVIDTNWFVITSQFFANNKGRKNKENVRTV